MTRKEPEIGTVHCGEVSKRYIGGAKLVEGKGFLVSL